MRILFIHQNFPGQFKYLAPALAARGHEVRAISHREGSPAQWKGVRIHNYRVARPPAQGQHPWLQDFEPKLLRAEAVLQLALALRRDGFAPDVVVAHPGWGESLFIKDVWPRARLGIYCEFYYQATGSDVGFDPEFPVNLDEIGPRIRMKNLGNLAHFEVADAGLSPTGWQASTFPAAFRPRISVIHDGIDTAAIAPRASARLSLQGQGGPCVLDRDSEVLTFVNRNLEPYRGYHVFCRMLPELLRRRPALHVLVVGGDGVSYGERPPSGASWRDLFFAEVLPQLPAGGRERVHFVGNLPYPKFVEMLQLSMVHFYLTYPFVLSWSLLEAMSAGCAIVASDTPPVAEVIQHGQTGLLANFFDRATLLELICQLLDDPGQRQRLGAAARDSARSRYDLLAHCLPSQLQWLESVAG